MKSRLNVVDVFHFRDGRTVLTVTAEGNPKLIEAGIYEVLSGGEVIAQVEVENEMVSRPNERPGHRSVSLAGRLDVPGGPPSRAMMLLQH